MADKDTKDTAKPKAKKDRRVIPFQIIDGGRADDADTEEDFFSARSKRKAEDGKSSPVAKAALDDTMSGKVLDAAIQSLALEEGKLLFEQEQEELRGFLDLEIIDRRVKIIGKMTDIILKRRAALAKRGLDIHSAQFRAAISSFLDLIQEAMELSGVPHGKIEAIMVSVADKMEDWETKLQHQLSGE